MTDIKSSTQGSVLTNCVSNAGHLYTPLFVYATCIILCSPPSSQYPATKSSNKRSEVVFHQLVVPALADCSFMLPLRSLKSFTKCGLAILPAFMLYAVFLFGRGVENHMQQANSKLNSTIVVTFHDAKQLDLQWAKNLTKLKHQRTKFAVSVLTREEDLVTRRWMGDKRVEDTTIFLLSDGVDVNSLQKVDGSMYGLTVKSNTARDAGAWILVSTQLLLHRLHNASHIRVTEITMQSW